MGEQKREKKTEKAKQAKSNGKAITKEKKAKSKKQAHGEPSQTETPSNEGETLDITSFLTRMAKEHNVPTSAYTQQRSRTEWERTILQIAGRLYSGNVLDAPVTRV